VTEVVVDILIVAAAVCALGWLWAHGGYDD